MVPELAPLLILGLATWRVASLLVNEAGPWDIFLKLREAIGITHDQDGRKVIIPDGFWAKLLSCIWCCSLWVGGLWLGIYFIFTDFAFLAAFVFALSTIAILIQKFVEK